ncbi:hypothetical protein Q8W71_27610 [Methylobacterium sp. NEAU 140]|uniref:hypothetical protein n=1 Tax=Methylobacterium sp. NEAU 140 TaxID=3064945 RepID=UPI002734254D|nr:hypothetical protein [Methylobacterium sp. NEAU 140]MDP4026396.1 hypothetical protein [Methylobacterium sp. NEAU 140]
MWLPDSITVTITELDVGDTVLIEIDTPAGRVDILCKLAWSGRTLYMCEAHVGGLRKGALRREGLNAIGARILIEAQVDALVVEGAERTTGAGPHRGRRPPPFRYPR